MSIAMTVVLPAPVASFSASRIELRVGVVVGARQVLEEAACRPCDVRRDLGQPDGRLDRLDLAEERADAAELVMPPVLEQARRLRRDLPLVRVRQARATASTLLAHLVDDRRRVVLLRLGREPLALVENNSSCLRRALALLRLRDRRDELGAAAALDDLLRRLPVCVQLPVPRRALVGGVEDRVVEERIGHGQCLYYNL